jgi:organic hydroperoxide reductase OsmC/OhrA
MRKQHHYTSTIYWTGNTGNGTRNYTAYERSHTVSIPGKKDIDASSDPAFRGDSSKHNPEDLLVGAVSGCHMLWYLHLCSVNGIVVTDYQDNATGVLEENEDGGGQFTSITLNPVVVITNESMVEKAKELHHQANQLCFIARSLNFKISHNLIIKVAQDVPNSLI